MVILIKELCKKQSITLTELERQLVFTKSSIRKWDENKPSIDKVEKVANYFGCTVDYLLRRTEKPNLAEYKLPPEYTIDGQEVVVDMIKEVIDAGLTKEDFENIIKLYKSWTKSDQKK